MNYDDLRRYQRMERASPKAAELPENYDSELFSLISSQKQSYGGSGSTSDLKMLENIFKIARDIYERREQKIIMRALADSRTNANDTQNLLQEEQDMYAQIKQALKEKRAYFDEILSGKKPKDSKKDSNILDEKFGSEIHPETENQAEDLNTVLVRIIKKVPKFVSADMSEYGPYDANELVNLPKKEAEILSKRGIVDYVTP